MVGPGDEIAAGRGHLRASHADREQAIGTLKAAYVAGMLAKDEFDLRVGQTLASRTYAELTALTADLPAGRRNTAAQARAGRGRTAGAATRPNNRGRNRAVCSRVGVPSLSRGR